jgi:hypothetical protein
MFEHHPLHGIQLVLSSVGKLTEGISMLHSNAHPHMTTQFWTKQMPCDGRCSNSCIQPDLNTTHFSKLWTAIDFLKFMTDVNVQEDMLYWFTHQLKEFLGEEICQLVPQDSCASACGDTFM